MKAGKTVAGTLLLLVLNGCSGHDAPKTPAPSRTVKGVGMETVSLEPLTEYSELPGTVRARTSAVLAARIAGTVTAVHLREGDRVGKGKLLVSIEAAENAAAAAGARAGVEEALRGVEEAESRRRLAEATFGRYRNLFEEQAVTRQEYEGKRMEQEVAQQGLARAKARLAQARQAARSAETVAGYTRIASPLSGTVTAKSVETGVTVFPGMPLLTLEGGAGYRLEVPVPETMLGRIRVGDRAEVSIEGADSHSLTVSEIVPAVDPASRTFTVKIELPSGNLRSGMYGKLLLPSGSRQGIRVPRSALVERGALTMVWVAGADNVVSLRLMKPGREVGDRVEALSGLVPGDRVIVSGTERLAEGMTVE